MEICTGYGGTSHAEIVHENGVFCPLCDALTNLEEVTGERDELESTVARLEADLEEARE